ncbi:porphobilinogen deaminase [Pseudovirgaria hyperparasitica]|uniref:hydroxymethylbilane synthase n=1 Tax=Pseudovirgaria hyperparasitica TaxID=470096 RepID=A0A6A6WL24_9PEZI|nr:porphobilinogen deaminase [Pseudovirgaria hyperparasitica]KAF2762881.1 porphobilinogen deaminase [Pseudovirgaria hyperparasitica]
MGTRRSALARMQTTITERALREAWPGRTYETVAIDTNLGDADKKTALHEMNAKNLWTHELEVLLDQGKLDLIVHSLKGKIAPNMPTQLPQNMKIGAILPRADARDAVIIHPKYAETHKTLATLPEGSVIGTSSLRRSAQLKLRYKHLKFANLRGNVGTRLAKLDAPDSEYAAIILAAAGILRLGLGNRISSNLSSNPDEGNVLHAVGQGAIGIEIKSEDIATQKLLEKIQCPWTTKACLAERSLMRTLEGGCSVPIGVETSWRKVKDGVATGVQPAADYDHAGAAVQGESRFTDDLTMKAIVVGLEGEESAEIQLTKKVATNHDAEEFGIEAARLLVEKGADKILQKIVLNRRIIEEQGGA